MTSFLILLAGLSSIILGFLSLRKKTRIRKSFSFFSFSVTFWILINLIFQITRFEPLVKLFYAAGSLALASGLLFTITFLYKKILRTPVVVIFAIALINFSISIFTDGVIAGVDQVFDTGYIARTGIYFPFYALSSVMAVVYFFILMLKHRKKSSGILRSQINYIILGFGAFGIITALVSFILPLFNYWKLTSLDSPSALFFVAGSFYAITKHRLLDIKLVVLRTISFSLIILFTSGTVLSLTLFIPEYLDISRVFQITINIVVATILVGVIGPLKEWMGKITDKLFFKATIDYQELRRVLAEVVNREIDLTKLVAAINDELVKGLKIQKARILLAARNRETYETISKRSDVLIIKKSSPIAYYLETSKRIIVLESLERRIEDTQNGEERRRLEESKTELDRLDAAIVAPIMTDQKLAAILILGIKKSGDAFSEDDLNTLEVLGPQLASAIEKSKLYDQVRRFNIKLQKEIAIATEGLRNALEEKEEQNRFLTALQSVTALITRSLDFKQVTQDIVNSISTKLGYIGGILLFYSEDKKKLYPQAITRVRYTKQIEKILPLKVEDYFAVIGRDHTLAIETIQTGVIQKSDKLSDFISPPVPTLVVSGIQKLIQGHGFVGVPITSEEENVGCLVFLTEESLDELSDRDFNMMTALADQTGIIYRNLQLVEKIKKANEELEEANEHLKQLDIAKSEFVSIASHQLRTPMTGIMGYLSMITSGDFGKVPKKQEGVLENLLEASQRMIQLINLFLDVSKIESGKLLLDRKPHHIEDLISQAVTSLKKQSKDKGLKLIFIKPKKTLPELLIDQKIYDVISNLIDNAIKYTEKGSVIVSAEKIDGNVKVTVKDTGRGIPAEEAKNLFNKFVRGYGIAQVNPDGSGLGLYVARRLTEAHGGKIWVESKGKNQGSSFIFTIPINPEQEQEEAT